MTPARVEGTREGAAPAAPGRLPIEPAGIDEQIMIDAKGRNAGKGRKDSLAGPVAKCHCGLKLLVCAWSPMPVASNPH